MSAAHDGRNSDNGRERWMYPLSSGVGADAKLILESNAEIQKRQIVGRPITPFIDLGESEGGSGSIAERLYNSLAQIKILTSQVAMHLSSEWRSMLFERVDELLDVDDWHADDAPVAARSFETFLRMVIYLRPTRMPGLGVSDRGYLIAGWTNGVERLTMEFFPNDKVTWVLSCKVDEQKERAAGETTVRRLKEILLPYKPSRWFDDVPG